MRAFLRSFVYASRGIVAGSRGRNFRVMLGVTVVVCSLAWWLDLGTTHWLALLLSMGLVLALELVNTAGETLIDILSPDHDDRYGQVKDVLAGAVLIAALAAAVVGWLVLGRPLLARLSG